MAEWSPPQFTYHRYADGTLVAVGSDGKPLACQPTLTTETVTIQPGDPSMPATTASVVVDQWGNRVDQYEIPPYTVQVKYDQTGDRIAVAVDANGQPVPLVPNMEVVTHSNPAAATVKMTDGSTATMHTYDGPQDFSIHVTASHTHTEGGVPEYEVIAVGSDGNPLPVQPNFYRTTHSDSSISWSAAWSGSTDIFTPPVYEFPEFSVHLDYSAAALDGRASAAPSPIAVGADGTPLAIQPDWQIDPADPTNVVAVMPDGRLRDAMQYEFPDYQVQLQYPAAVYHGGAAPIPHPIAVDDNGVPLPIQPVLNVDPPDPSDPNGQPTVTATYGDQTTQEIRVQEPPKDFYVHVESSGPGGAHATPSYAATAVDANGQPLPIQPHLVVDPSDPTKVTAYFPDGTTSTPTPLYPPPGEAPETWPPDEWPPKDDEADDEAEADKSDETDDGTAGLPADTVTTPDDTTAPPDDVAADASDEVTVDAPGDTTEPDLAAEPRGDVAASDDVTLDEPARANSTDRATPPPEGVDEVSPDMEEMDEMHGAIPADGQIRHESEAPLAEATSAGDGDEPVDAVDDLLIAGLDAPASDTARPMGAEATAPPTQAGPLDGLVTAGLEPEVEAREFKVEEPVNPEDKLTEPEWKLNESEEPEWKIDEGDEAELKWYTPVDEELEAAPPLPSTEPAASVPVEPVEAVESLSLAEPVEETVIEPIEIVVETLEATPPREMTSVETSDEEPLYAREEHEEEDGEAAQA